jgi:hypothetical protein
VTESCNDLHKLIMCPASEKSAEIWETSEWKRENNTLIVNQTISTSHKSIPFAQNCQRNILSCIVCRRE